jgi:glycerophosphoryl diester phosphodiesterase
MKIKVIKFLSWSLVALVVMTTVLAVIAKPIPQHPFFNQESVLVMAHRGGRNLWPENTLYAFERAVELGVDVLEMDVHSTNDGAIIVMHDSSVDRTTNGAGPIQNFTLADLQTLDAGYSWTEDEGQTYPYRNQNILVPMLEEVFNSFPDVPMNIEIKQTQPSIITPLCDMIRTYQMTENVLVASFDMDTIKEFRNTCPEVATTAGEDEVRMLYVLSRMYLGRLYSPPAEAVQVPEYWGDIHVLTERFVRAAHNRNIEVHVWTINDEESLRLVLDIGADGIITDNPDRLLNLLGR